MPKHVRTATRVGASYAFDIWSSSHKNKSIRESQLSLSICVDKAFDAELLYAAKHCFLPETTNVNVRVLELSEKLKFEATDIIVCLSSDAQASFAEALCKNASAKGVATLLVAESAAAFTGNSETTPDLLAYAYVSSKESFAECVAEKLLSIAGDNVLTLAAAFPEMRPTFCQDMIQGAAISNAVVGAVDLIHGADLPIMAVTELKLALDLALAHGKNLDLKRAPELALTLAFAFLYRGVARSLVKLAPNVAFLTRGALAYLGTRLSAELLLGLYQIPEDELEEFVEKNIVPYLKSALDGAKMAASRAKDVLHEANVGTTVQSDYRGPLAVFEDDRL